MYVPGRYAEWQAHARPGEPALCHPSANIPGGYLAEADSGHGGVARGPSRRRRGIGDRGDRVYGGGGIVCRNRWPVRHDLGLWECPLCEEGCWVSTVKCVARPARWASTITRARPAPPQNGPAALVPRSVAPYDTWARAVRAPYPAAGQLVLEHHCCSRRRAVQRALILARVWPCFIQIRSAGRRSSAPVPCAPGAAPPHTPWVKLCRHPHRQPVML